MGKRYTRCKYCHRPETETFRLSARGCCFKCGLQASIDTATQLANKSGPAYEHWLKKTLAANDTRVKAMREEIDRLARERDSNPAA